MFPRRIAIFTDNFTDGGQLQKSAVSFGDDAERFYRAPRVWPG
jgi:hypothetical protein